MQIFLFSLTSILLGLLIGYADFRADEVQPAVLLILIFTFIFGFLKPRQAWLWALGIGGGVPLIYFIGITIGVKPLIPAQPNAFATFIALLPAFVGAYTGVAAKWLVNELRQQDLKL